MLYAAALIGIFLIMATRLRLNHYFYLGTWDIWAQCAVRFPAGRRREHFIGIYGP